MTLPLAGIRVLETSAYISGPYASALFASLGADVVKIEPPKGGDAFRRGVEIGSPYFVQYNAGKRSLAVDLKKPEGADLVKALIPKFDVFIENARPGKMAQLGLGPEVLQAINPQLIYSSVSGFGDSGPYRDRAAYDSMGQSMGGYYSIMNEANAARLTGTCIADLITAMTSAMGILASLVGRSQRPDRAGIVTQTSLLEAMSTITIDAYTQMMETGQTPLRQSRHPQAQNFCLNTSDGGAITLHLSSSEKFWQATARAIGREDLIQDPRFRLYNDRMANYFELVPHLAEAFAKRTRAEWEAELIAHDVPFAPVLTMMDWREDEQIKHLDLLEPARGDAHLVRAPWRFDGQRPARNFDAPYIGQHSREVAAEVLSPSQIDDLVAKNVLYQAPQDLLEAAQ